MRRLIKVLPVIMALAAVVAIPGLCSERKVSADPAGVYITNATFPDATFRHYVEYYIDGMDDSYLSPQEIAGVTELDLSDLGIADLTGIGYFTELEKLDCSNNALTSLNLNSNTKLRSVNCSENEIQYILLGQCLDLEVLDCSLNSLKSLTLNKNIKLSKLYCQYNQLETLNIKYNTVLEMLYCNGNKLKKIDTAGHPLIKTLFCYANQLTELDLTSCELLEDLYASDNELTSIDLSHNPDLWMVQLEDNHITRIDLSHNKHLLDLYIDRNPISTLDLSKNTELKVLYADDMNLSKLDVSHNTALTDLNCGGNHISALDVSMLPDLKHLVCDRNSISKIDVSHNPLLFDLRCQNNNIKQLNIYYNPELKTVYQNGTKLAIPTAATAYYNGSWPVYDYVTKALAIDDSVVLVLTKPTSTPTPTATPTSTPTPTKKPTNTPTPKPATSASSSSDGEGGVEGFVERLYSVALDRESDPNGKADWVDQIRSGELTGADAARGFFLSPEFINSDLSNADFLTRLYRTFFDREPDEYGFNNWMAELIKGASRESILAGFINSTEWANLCLKFGIASGGTGVPNITIEPNEKVIGFATRLYTTCLCRDFDAWGLNDWARQLANRQISGSQAAYGFFFSDEFINGNYSDAEYVTRLYHTFMDREPDPDGFADWTGQLAAGASRESVFRGFAESVEWAGICADYGILK